MLKIIPERCRLRKAYYIRFIFERDTNEIWAKGGANRLDKN